MQLRTVVNKTEVVIDLPGVSEAAFQAVGIVLDEGLAKPKGKNRDAIRDAYLTALKMCPAANASDLWHHVVYRQYCEILPKHRPQNPDQSWKKSSGDALEIVVETIYKTVLLPHDIRIELLIGRPRKLAALKQMGIEKRVGSDKLDVALYLDDTDELFGGIHVKASLAERIGDAKACSRAMMKNGYFSPVWTLDVKSFPPPGDLVNRGELGTPEVPTVKRKYVEEHGDFDHIFSANARTVPSSDKTKSGKRVIRIDPATQPDPFAQEVITRAEAFRSRGRAANPPPPRSGKRPGR